MNQTFRLGILQFLTVVLFACLPLGHAAPVLMISIDGMKPEYVTQAAARGIHVPYLSSMIREGTYADGVVGVWPTLTYPSHTTLVTGVWPAEHGISNNLEFDPNQLFSGAWNWYAAQIRVPTLWQVAHHAGLRTASVGWPVSVGNTDIDWLIPEYWRSSSPSVAVDPLDRYLLAALSRPDVLLSQLEPAAGPYMMGNNTTIGGDEIKTRYAVEMIRRCKPGLMTIHLSSLDDAEHAHGPFSKEADRDLEAIDGMVQRLAATATAANPTTVVVVVSDHGFMTLTHWVKLYIPFLQAGLLHTTTDPETGTTVIRAWQAEPWLAGGMAAIMLHDPSDHVARQRVGELLKKLAANAENGIAEVLDQAAIENRGAFPDAAFLVVMKPGYYLVPGTSGSVVGVIPGTRGSHGFSPEYPELRASFFAVGSGIARHRDLGIVDMRQIAPSVAKILDVSMPSAKAAPLNLQP